MIGMMIGMMIIGLVVMEFLFHRGEYYPECRRIVRIVRIGRIADGLRYYVPR